MSLLKWQEQAIKKDKVAIIAPRQAGKTYAAMQWAKQIHGKVLYVVSNAQMVPFIVQAFYETFPGVVRVVQPSRGRINYHDGTEIQVIAGRNELGFRGQRVDAVVLDDVDYIPEEAFFNAIMCCPSQKIFAGCTNPNRGAAKILKRFKDMEQILVSDKESNSSYKYLLETTY